MGHRLTTLELPEDLRQWREAGLELVFPDGSVSSLDSAPAPVPDVAPADASGMEPEVEAGDVCEPFADAGDDSYEPGASSDGHDEYADDERDRAPAPPSAPSRPTPRAPELPDDDPVWPAPWNRWLAKFPPTCRVVLTYWELADDLGAAPDDARRELWRKIICQLPWSKVGITYWPLSEPGDGGLTPNPFRFWQGVLEFQATSVLCFGRRAAGVLFPGMPFAYKTIDAGQYRVLLLPGPEDMLPDDRRMKGIAWNMLKDYEP